MQFKIEDLGPVQKSVRVSVPARRVDAMFSMVYNQFSQKASLPGFRKGKVPMSHIRKLYGDRARFDVTERLVDAGWKTLLDEHDIVPLSEPKLDAAPVEAGQEFAFTMTFDVAPDIELHPFSDLSVEQEKWTASDDVVRYDLEQLAEQFAEFEDISDRTVAEDGDQVIIDYSGSVNGEVFPGGTAEDAPLVLGSGQFIPGFEEQIVGQSVDSSFDVNVSFPEEYHAENLKGQAAVFACTLKGLKSKKIPQVGPELAERVGEESIEILTEKMKEQIEERFNDQGRNKARTAVREALGQQYNFEVPPTMLERAINDRRADFVRKATADGKSEAEAKADSLAEITANDADVTSDLRAYLVVDQIARSEKIEVGEDDMRVELQKMMQSMGPYAQQIMQMYRQPERRAALIQRIREDKVLDFLLTQASVTTVEKDVPQNDQEDGQ